MQLHINGQPVETRAQTLSALLKELQIASPGIAVAVNGNVVRRAQHADLKLKSGDQIEIIRAVQGG